MEKQKLIYVESKALFSPSSVSNKAIVFIKDTKEIWTHGTYFICSNIWATPITLTLSGDSTGSVSIDGSGNASIVTTTNYLSTIKYVTDANDAANTQWHKIAYYANINRDASNLFPWVSNANAILSLNVHDYSYTHLLGFSSNGNIYHRRRSGGTWETSWKTILNSSNYTNFPHTFASLTNKPTTLSGYGITDCIPIIKGGLVTTDTDLSTLGMTISGVKFSISYTNNANVPSWGYGYSNFLMFRAASDTYSGIATDAFSGAVTFIGGRNLETAANNVPNWWFRIYGTSGLTYNLATIQTAINNLGSTYLPLTGGTLTDTLILKAGAFTASNSNSYSGGRYQAVSKPNIRLIGDSTYGLSTIEFTSQKGDTSINKPSDSGFIQFQPYGVSALSSVGSHPTLKTSGESNALVLGVTNDADDIIVLLSPNISGLRHACGATEYYLPHITTSTTTANKPLVSTTTAHVYTLGDEYLPLKGGTMTGKITLWSSNADAANTGGLNANNSNIYGLNSLYFADPSETAAEGINFYRSSTTVDSLWGSNGNLYWTPNRTYGNAGTNYYVLTSNNYSTHLNNTYLPLRGGVMTGLIRMTRGASYLTDTGSDYSMLGMINSGTSTTGMNSEEGMFINVPFTLATLRTSGNNLWHYNHANSARYLILDANNYTNYTIPYSKVNSYTGILPIINNEKLYHNDSIKFLYFTTSDNGGAISYLLIAELANYGTGTNTSYINYGLVGTIYGYRGGNMANTHAYNVSVGASIGSITFTRVYTSTITDALVPMIVKYDSKYYIALLKSGSSTGHYFIGLATNLLSSYITVNDSSLVEIVIKPSGEVSTGIKYYNGGDPKYYLHEGNYSNYALPLTGGTLTGTLTSSSIVPRASVTYDIGTTSAYYNNIYALYFKRKDSSDSYVLLGGGGHKLLSELSIGSADKLNTTRYFWGREFNGTLDVNGQINIVRNSGFASYNEGVRILASSTEWAGIFLGTDGTDKGYITSLWNISKTNSDSLRISRGATSNYLLDIISNGNIGIGTTSPSAKLEVSGNAIIGNSSNSCNLTIKSKNSGGVATLYFDNGVYSTDLPWKGYIAVSGYGDTSMRVGTGLNGNALVIHGMIFKLPRDLFGYSFRNNSDNDIAYLSYLGKLTTKLGYVVENGTASQFLKADGSLDSNSYLPLSGGTLGNASAPQTSIYLRSSTAQLLLLAHSNSTNYILSGNLTFNGNADLRITGYLDSTGSNLYLKFANIYCRGDHYTNIDSGNYSSYALPLSGGTMTGALNFKNNTWNLVGDDVYIGDCNVGGMLGIKSANRDTPGFAMYNSGGTLLGKLYASGSDLYWSGVRLSTSTKEAYLEWGGQNLASNSSPIDTILEPSLGANRLAFLSPDAIDIEYSQDGGTTWLNYNATDAQKVSLFCGGGNYSSFYLGGNSSTDPSIDRTPWRLRITISVIGYSLYCQFIKFLIYTTDVGNTTYCLLLGRKYSDYQNNVDTWVTFLTARIAGWSGWNTINHPNGITLPHTANYAQLRFEFYMTSLGTTGRASIISRIEGFAHKCWSWPSNMAGYGNIYSYDWQLNVTFPAQVTATGGFSGNLTGNVTGNLTGNADTASNISTVNPILALPFEKNTIQVVSNPLGALAELLGTAAAITHALRFNWYNTAYEIGNVRGGASNSLGFGITYGNNNLCLLVKTNGTYSPYGFIGSLSGNASTASKWKDARTITLTGDVTGSVSLDGSSNVTLTTSTSGTGTTSFLKCIDKRNSYPALIVTSGGNIGAAFMSASKLGLSEGSHYEALILRGWIDSSGGNDNALLFSKDTSSVYHSLYAFGSTTTWGTLYKFLDSGNYKNYAPSLSGEGATGTWGINISGTASKVANALTIQLNGGTTAGTNKFVYDGSAAYTVNITPASIGAAASSHTHNYLPLFGGTLGNTSAIETLLRLTSGTATLRLIAYSNTFNYIQSGTADFSGNAVLQITGYNGNVGSDLYLKFTNIYCRSGNYTNIDSGNYGSYALPLSGGTMTGALNTANIYPKANAGFNIGSTSSYYNIMYAYYFKKYGSDDNYLLLGGGGHKAVSDFAPNNVATLSSSGMGNSDLWTLVFEKSYPANYWYAPTTMFYIRSGTAGCGILCFYNYWASGTQLDDYEREVWFFGALKSETGITFGGANRDINDFFRIYIDKANFKYCIYYNRYNDLSLKILELLFFTVSEPGEYLSTGSLRSSFFTNSTIVVDLPTESSTLVRVPIKTTYNHDRTIRTSKSIYASSFYENSDIRLKENVRGIDLSDLTKLVDLVQFNFKDSGTKKYGVIAQLLELVGLQNLVYENNGNKAVDYISLLVLETLRLRNEIKELKEKLDKKELSS